MIEAETKGARWTRRNREERADERIRDTVIGSRVLFGRLDGLEGLEAQLFKCLQTFMRDKTANPLGNQGAGSRQAPCKDPHF